MAKNVLLLIPGAENNEVEGRETTIEADYTATDLLNAANLDPNHWMLQLERDGKFTSFKGQDKLHRQVKDGEKVHIVPSDMYVGVVM